MKYSLIPWEILWAKPQAIFHRISFLSPKYIYYIGSILEDTLFGQEELVKRDERTLYNSEVLCSFSENDVKALCALNRMILIFFQFT